MDKIDQMSVFSPAEKTGEKDGSFLKAECYALRLHPWAEPNVSSLANCMGAHTTLSS